MRREGEFSSASSEQHLHAQFPCLLLEEKTIWQSRRAADRSLIKAVSPDNFAIHTARTLDEAYFPGLAHNVLKKRNNDQVVTREYEHRHHGQPQEDTPPILIVSQLWIWRFDRLVLTAYAMPVDKVKPTRKTMPSFNAHRMQGMTATIIADRVERFGQKQANDLYEPPLTYFECGLIRILSDVQQYTRNKEYKSLQMDQEGTFLSDIAW